jgi:hypothetical protein
LKQENHEFKASLGYKARQGLKKPRLRKDWNECSWKHILYMLLNIIGFPQCFSVANDNCCSCCTCFDVISISRYNDSFLFIVFQYRQKEMQHSCQRRNGLFLSCYSHSNVQVGLFSFNHVF